MLHVVMSAFASIGFAVLALWGMDYPAVLAINIIVGAGIVVPFYVPYSVYASAAPPERRALSVSVIITVGGCWGAAITAFIGHLRATHTKEVTWQSVTGIASCAAATNSIVMMIFYRRTQATEYSCSRLKLPMVSRVAGPVKMNYGFHLFGEPIKSGQHVEKLGFTEM